MKVVVLQKMGEMVDGKIHFLAGEDISVFNLEDGDAFFTAAFQVDPFNLTQSISVEQTPDEDTTEEEGNGQ